MTNNQPKHTANTETQAYASFVPDLCQLNTTLLLLLLTQILVFILSLALSREQFLSWELLGQLSLFCQAIVMSAAALTCQLRPVYEKLSTPLVALTFCCCNLLLASVAVWLVDNYLPSRLSVEMLLPKILVITLLLSLLGLRYFYLQHQWQQQKQAELGARLQALQARIKPHFLFNSMNSIASLIDVNPARAEDAVLDLAELFRATLNNQKMLVPLREELSLCKRYLNIESLRLGDRLQTQWRIAPDAADILVPSLSLQPLFENAVYHGIQPLIEGGYIRIEAYRENDCLYIMISNPCSAQQTNHKGNKIALDNIRHRLAALYDQQAILKTSEHDGEFTVTLRLPELKQNDAQGASTRSRT